MRRVPSIPRRFCSFKLAWQGAAALEDVWKGSWNESACYEFTVAEIQTLRMAAADLHALYGRALDAVIQHGWWERLGLGPLQAEAITRSWERRDPALMGRFDLAWDGEAPPKLLEYNADTPMSLTEASLGQASWLQEVCPGGSQWNDLHRSLVQAWRVVAAEHIHFAGVLHSADDRLTLRYLERCAREAGKQTSLLEMKEIGWHRTKHCFVDTSGRPIECLYKLYPWEWLWHERFAEHLPGRCQMFMEPAWKLAWNSKGMLPILWELFPDHPNLLPAYEDSIVLGQSFVKKPKLGREGANIAYVVNGVTKHSRAGPYDASGFIYQALAPDARLDDRTATLGVWVIGGEPCGLGIRTDQDRIVHGHSPFVPHRTGAD